MTGYEIAALVTFIASTLGSAKMKSDAERRGKNKQRAILDDFYAKKNKLSDQNTEKQKELLSKLDKKNVSSDIGKDSRRINAMMKDMSNVPTSDKLVSSSAPKVIQDAMANTLATVGSNVQKRGLSKAQLDALSGVMDKYNPDFMDANTLASNIAGKLRGEEGAMKIGLEDASHTYDKNANILDEFGKIAAQYLLYNAGSSPSSSDPKIIGDTPGATGPPGRNYPTS